MRLATNIAAAAATILLAGVQLGCGPRSADATAAPRFTGVLEGPYAAPTGDTPEITRTPAEGDPFAPRSGYVPPATRPADRVIRPAMVRDTLVSQTLAPPAGLADLRPALVLATGQARAFHGFNGPALMRLDRREAGGGVTTLAEVEVNGGQIALLDRRLGVVLDGRRLVAGPLAGGATYELYALPPGGVLREATVTLTRPKTKEDQDAERQAAEAALQPQANEPQTLTPQATLPD